MPPQRATLLQVAQRAGVSRSTASFVLAGRHLDMRISENARQRVLRAAQELDYRPNLMARSLRTKVTKTIALVSDTIASDPYAGRAIHGSLAAAVAHDHLLFIGETEGDSVVEGKLIADLLDRQVDAFVYASMFTRYVRVPKQLKGRPVVLLNCLTRAVRPVYHSVIPDEAAAGRNAARTLVGAGHREGIHLVGKPAAHVFASRERLAGMRDGFGAAGVRLAGTIECDWWPEPAYEAMRRALAGGLVPKALVCINDRVAMGAYQALREAGRAIPDDVSVVSFDDSDLAAWLRPQLTSIALPHYQLGWTAVELLLGAAQDPAVHRVPMPVRLRASLGKP
ncbi:LacI family DNA-binding transcriptional regulator [Couchioplanes caeruleus]|uniref:LacI family transcriptional regulator n=2 Tax=Couchioplanes caeruleus TaxID=56438 RepID=A0A1K0FP21_9ACTN|nr:LacI family DNA-binding transcriptional regulator [Couchioplanes caeruleus]OJF14591.1 LacI family transcriptional regulator [Couchioplanes caeruleus subsp. caeruleus]ROP32113.1 LacI family transcriptional regulator [Couchioplanes caeruleus]